MHKLYPPVAFQTFGSHRMFEYRQLHFLSSERFARFAFSSHISFRNSIVMYIPPQPRGKTSVD
jgi:hypothetical protein